jgi:UDP-N-acetylglucosamine diphosphorylase / glucose-1-phosphate thymidylyltransferase / UDP-N-acetylgalactosamine diphosphorylase / glucosamine-1-phosphate N-acetyltransferase / galactosamine-1-phosphate N-acetyltransferase
MSAPRLYLFDDNAARDWQPFALTRPAGELLLGAYTLRARAERVLHAKCAGHISSAHLIGFEEHDAAPVIDRAAIPGDAARIFVSSRFVVDDVALPDRLERATVLHVADEVVGMAMPAGAPNPEPSWFEQPDDRGANTGLAVRGRMIRNVWDLVAQNPAQVERDFHSAAAAQAAGPDASSDLPDGLQAIRYRPGLLRLGSNVTIEPHVVFDFSNGPIWLGDDVSVLSFARIAGPAFIGAGSSLLGGPCATISIGPRCKIRGELEESIVLGYSNKAHDGFLGHAYVGRWVNLGALTTNSDLKNNYGNIRIWTPGGDVDTGLMKLGCLIGDHAKTGIGALINTGSVIGAGSNIYGSELPPKYVPPFSWGSGSTLTTYELERFMNVAETVMRRRDVTLSSGMRHVLESAWQRTRLDS